MEGRWSSCNIPHELISDWTDGINNNLEQEINELCMEKEKDS